MRRKLNYKKLGLVFCISGIMLLTLGVTFSKISDNNSDKSSLAIEKEEEKEKEVFYVGTNEEGKNFTYNANKVAQKLDSYDYSNNGKKIVFLTFDDGTSKTNTPEVLRILKENDVKATFFLTGSNIVNGGEEAKKLVKEEFNNGHALANHSYSHDVRKLYPGRVLDLEAFKEDFKKNDDLLKEILGQNFSTRVIRCPGGYMSWKNMQQLDAYLDENDMVSIDWNALNGDAEGRKKDAQGLYDYAVKTAEGKDMVVLLMHDTYGKEETVKALPQIIKYFKENGYEFKTLS